MLQLDWFLSLYVITKMLVLLVGVEVVVAQLGGLRGANRGKLWCQEGARASLVVG